jgi:3-hydroxy-9,10-secoandrosta-1,3,5(10)-triene-9,17-dione monooxygenase
MASADTTLACTKEELVSRAASLVPALKARALMTERQRQLPPQTVADLKQAGLVRCVNPERFGGFVDIDALFDCVMELGRGCGATAWCYSVWTVHNWMVGHWPEQAQTDYFADGPDVLCSSSFLPLGKIESVEGGYSLAGRWDFSSGCLYSDWCMLGATGPDGPVLVLVPRADYKIIDTWHVSGLEGTGSNDIEVDGVFVPAYRVASMQTMGRSSPAWELHGRPSYRLPNTAFQAFTLVAPLSAWCRARSKNSLPRSRISMAQAAPPIQWPCS